MKPLCGGGYMFGGGPDGEYAMTGVMYGDDSVRTIPAGVGGAEPGGTGIHMGWPYC